MKKAFEWINRVGSLLLIILGLLLIISAVISSFTFLGLADQGHYLEYLDQRTFSLIFVALIDAIIGSASLIAGVLLKKRNTENIHSLNQEKK